MLVTRWQAFKYRMGDRYIPFVYLGFVALLLVYDTLFAQGPRI